MHRRTLVLAVVGLVAAVASGFAWHAVRSPDTPDSRAKAPSAKPAYAVASPGGTRRAAPVRSKRRTGNLDLVFLVFSDTHFGFDVSERDHSGRPRDPVKDPQGVEASTSRPSPT